jgi:hypothetical protein
LQPVMIGFEAALIIRLIDSILSANPTSDLLPAAQPCQVNARSFVW